MSLPTHTFSLSFSYFNSLWSLELSLKKWVNLKPRLVGESWERDKRDKAEKYQWIFQRKGHLFCHLQEKEESALQSKVQFCSTIEVKDLCITVGSCVRKLREVNSSVQFIFDFFSKFPHHDLVQLNIYDVCTVLHVLAELCLISWLERQKILLDKVELMEIFYSTVIQLASCMILRNVITFLKVNKNILTGKIISKEEFGLA